MSAFATVYSPLSYAPAFQLAHSRCWRKKVLPIGDISYQGRTLHFTPAYIQGLADAFRDNAYDQVSFQLAPSDNSHSNDPERHRGTIIDMKAEANGLYIVLDPTERGQQVLQENPYLGVSCRIVEQYQRPDGRFYPAAVQHILGTLDPRIPGLGAWQQVNLSGDGGQVIIDLSAASFPGEPGPGLTQRELHDLLDVLAEVDAEELPQDGGDLTDRELADLMQAAEAEQEDAMNDLTEFNAVHAASYADGYAREQARQVAQMQDLLAPARRDEDKLARAVQRAQAGVYDTLGLSNQAAAIELASQHRRSPCGPPDEFGRCSSRYHGLECAHQVGVDWLASNPPRSTYQASLANTAAGFNLSGTPIAIFDDPR